MRRGLGRSNFERTRGPLQVLANYHHVMECGTSRHDVLIYLSKFLAVTVAEYNLARRGYRLYDSQDLI